MNNKKIIIAGGTGFIGEELSKYFGKENDIIILSRKINHTKTNRNNYSVISKDDLQYIQYLQWDGKTIGEWGKSFEDADIIINLAGKTVNCRYNEKNKQEIFDSRTNATKIIGEAIRNCTIPPKLWINASSATIYRHAEDRPQDEYTGEFLNDFSVQVCQLWEKTFYEQRTPFTRKIALRMAITLGAGGVMIPYFNLLKFGLGGYQGSGKQMYSWVHIEDTCRLIEWIYEHKEMEGIYNCSSPHPVSNKNFMDTLRRITNTKLGLPAYKWMMKFGAALIGTEAELVLKSRWVVPTKILETGFTFKYPLLEEALKEIINKVPRKQYQLF